jgi:hypothetical protein
MFENIEPKFFKILSLTVRESSYQEEKVIKNGNRIRLRANYFQNLRNLKKFLLFAFVRQCLSKNLTEIHLNRVINYLSRNLRRKWSKKVNVECDTDDNFKDDQGFFTVFPAIMFRFKLRAKFLQQNGIFSSILILFTLIYCRYKRLSYRVKRHFIW